VSAAQILTSILAAIVFIDRCARTDRQSAHLLVAVTAPTVSVRVVGAHVVIMAALLSGYSPMIGRQSHR
jgi:hypothetical protein